MTTKAAGVRTSGGPAAAVLVMSLQVGFGVGPPYLPSAGGAPRWQCLGASAGLSSTRTNLAMQTLIHIFCKAGPSLRDRIAKDGKHLEKFELYVESQKNPTRALGWTKVKSLGDKDGAINVDWDKDASVLVCRVVTRGRGDPAPIVGDLVRYLLSHHFSRFRMLTLVPEVGK